MKSLYPIYCLIIVGAFAFLSFTGRSLFNYGSKREWTRPGQRTIYYHK